MELETPSVDARPATAVCPKIQAGWPVFTRPRPAADAGNTAKMAVVQSALPSFKGSGHMSNRYCGSCLCGEVRFEIEGEFERFYLCHCGYCRKDTGSAHAANLFSSSATLQWISGEQKVRKFDLPSTRHSRCFCGTCGSALPIMQMNGKLLVVPAGSLDSEVRIRPDAHLFVSSRANWDRALEEVQTVDTFPS